MLKISRLQSIRTLFTTKFQPAPTIASLKFSNNFAATSGNSEKLIGFSRGLHLSSALAKYINKNSKSSAEDSDDEDDDATTHFQDERDSKVIKTKLNSLRADLVVKSGLNIARNKIETIFYDSKIRVNGKKIPKKSMQLNVGDEIDVIKGLSSTNPSHIVVSRVVILAADEREEDLSVHLRRYKTLLIENYSGADAFKGSGSTEH